MIRHRTATYVNIVTKETVGLHPQALNIQREPQHAPKSRQGGEEFIIRDPQTGRSYHVNTVTGISVLPGARVQSTSSTLNPVSERESYRL